MPRVELAGLSWGSPSSPLPSPATPTKQLRWEGRVLEDKERKPGGELPDAQSTEGASVLSLSLSLSFRENVVVGGTEERGSFMGSSC